MNKKGFTLIELLAVIIILGILMIIAIPSVTKYISDSRKSSYVDTAKEVIGSARNLVNSGNLEMYATNTTYYIPTSCIKTENDLKSPYGVFTKAYVGVIYDGQGYKYYWISVDDAGQGVSKITPLDKLDTDSIESDLKDSDIESVVTTTGIGNRTEIKILECNKTTNVNSWEGQYHLDDISNNVSEDNGNDLGSDNNSPVCIPATILHTTTCSGVVTGCNGDVGNGNIITYGTIPNGSPKSGDAYDCKVTTNGTYSERFYYISSEGDNSILIYYKNINDQNTNSYSVLQNYHGPVNAYTYLPSTSDWNNNKIIPPGTRIIVNEKGTNTTQNGYASIDVFTYTDKAARMLSLGDVLKVCLGNSYSNSGYLFNCHFLMENIGQYEKDNGTRSYGYWLETPDSTNSNKVYNVNGFGSTVRSSEANSTEYYGVRPVITIATSDLGQ